VTDRSPSAAWGVAEEEAPVLATVPFDAALSLLEVQR
jgi:hypothetical protein